MGSRIVIGPGIEEVEPYPCQGAPRGAVIPGALPLNLYGDLYELYEKTSQFKKNWTDEKV